jgi:NAD(P)-dependent dehydrogenase (short-subunit alcohol dehydrogenase family)
MYEGKPVGTPDAGAFWRVANQHDVQVLFTAPTAIRAIRAQDPTGVETAMITAASMGAFIGAHPELAADVQNPMPVGLIDVADVSNAILYLVSDEGRYITGTTLSVDAGFANKK